MLDGLDARQRAAVLEGMRRSEGWAMYARRLNVLRENAIATILEEGTDPVTRAEQAGYARALGEAINELDRMVERERNTTDLEAR